MPGPSGASKPHPPPASLAHRLFSWGYMPALNKYAEYVDINRFGASVTPERPRRLQQLSLPLPHAQRSSLVLPSRLLSTPTSARGCGLLLAFSPVMIGNGQTQRHAVRPRDEETQTANLPHCRRHRWLSQRPRMAVTYQVSNPVFQTSMTTSSLLSQPMTNI